MEKCTKKDDATEAILAFDTLYTNNHLKMMKLLLPYLENGHQKKLAVFIKFQEFLYTMNFFRQYSVSLYSADSSHGQKKELDFNSLLPLLLPYCNEKERNMLSHFSQMQNMMHLYQDMSQYIPMMQQMMSSMNGSVESENKETGNGMMDMIKNMMSPEQQDLFSMLMEGGTL